MYSYYFDFDPSVEFAEIIGAPAYQQSVTWGSHFLSEHPAFMGALTRVQAEVRDELSAYDLIIVVGADPVRMSVWSPVEAVPPDLAIDWSHLLELAEPGRANNPNTQYSRRIQRWEAPAVSEFVKPSGERVRLLLQDIERGLQLDLPSGQAVAHQLGIKRSDIHRVAEHLTRAG